MNDKVYVLFNTKNFSRSGEDEDCYNNGWQTTPCFAELVKTLSYKAMWIRFYVIENELEVF